MVSFLPVFSFCGGWGWDGNGAGSDGSFGIEDCVALMGKEGRRGGWSEGGEREEKQGGEKDGRSGGGGRGGRR